MNGSLIPPPTDRKSKENMASWGEEVVLKTLAVYLEPGQSSSAEARRRKVISL